MWAIAAVNGDIMANRNWEIVEHSGQHMVLECGTERRDVPRPSDPAKRAYFNSLRPGQLIDDATLISFLGIKL
jgi:hypothetical protein